MVQEGPRVLVVDDEPQIRRLLTVALSAHQYQVETCENGKEALQKTATYQPDLVILDLILPDIPGIEVIKRVREWSSVPILMLSVHGREEDKIAALDAGADDYVTKPFSMGELLARMRVALRHATKGETDPVIRVGDLRLDLHSRQVFLRDQEIKLTPTEYNLLKVLASHAGRVVTQPQLLRMVWGPGYEEESHYLRVYIAQLRRKLEDSPTRPQYILTEPGVGYRFRAGS